MEADIQLALIEKARQVFESDTTSFALSPHCDRIPTW